MALSYYSNCDAFPGPDINPDSLPLMELPQGFLEPDSDVYDNHNYPAYDCMSGAVTPFDDLTGESFLLQQNYEQFHYPKRHKSEDVDYSSFYTDYSTGYFNGIIVPNPSCLSYSYPEIPVVPSTLPEFPVGPPTYDPGSCDLKKEQPAGSTSAQSIAARQRRRKITEKTQELGKLVPGGQKMNTAEMLQSAYKYIKFLQAQVGVLEFMNSYSQVEEEEGFEDEELCGLLQSSLIQEKLYATENCLVRRRFVQELSRDQQIVKSNPGLLTLIVKSEHVE